jgi:hypothetical protein
MALAEQQQQQQQAKLQVRVAMKCSMMPLQLSGQLQKRRLLRSVGAQQSTGVEVQMQREGAVQSHAKQQQQQQQLIISRVIMKGQRAQ